VEPAPIFNFEHPSCFRAATTAPKRGLQPLRCAF
jgi:hypothetical protein